ncbi:Morn repeat protein [Pandoravirus kuranda]|uniref:Morn repeat protein n=1 Tax=Pandoravirus kuranda TaxID=3019033 RepID=A0AA95EIJ1_9VIRU|nr:Morn repeat protein [Pandoravirus kuranda]
MQVHTADDDTRVYGQQQQDKPSWFSLLPDELVVAVLLALGDDPRSLTSWARTCKRHAAIAQDPEIWRNMCAIRFPTPLHERFADFGKDHQWVYRAHCLRARQDVSGPSARAVRPQYDHIRRVDIVRQWFYCGDFCGGCASGYGVGMPMRATEQIASIDRAVDIALSGGKYEGMWNDNMPHGFGVRVYPDCACYTGAWVCGQKCGRGVMVWSNGSIYDGEWAEGKRHGRGIFTVPGAWRYDGEWKDDVIHGHGTRIEDDGRTYDGEWVEGKRHGRGTFTVPGAWMYDGEWKDDMIRGRGIHTDTDGNTYDGEWNSDAFSGHAVFVEGNGKRYEGGWVMYSSGPGCSRSHGRGVCTYPDGSVIDGTWDGTQCLSCVGITHAPRDDNPGGCASDPCMACRALGQDTPAPMTE